MATENMIKWIETQTDVSLEKGLVPTLQDGVVLIQLAQCVNPKGLKKQYRTSEDRVDGFLHWLKKRGLKDKDLFEPQDLIDNKKPAKVAMTLRRLHRLVLKKQAANVERKNSRLSRDTAGKPGKLNSILNKIESFDDPIEHAEVMNVPPKLETIVKATKQRPMVKKKKKSKHVGASKVKGKQDVKRRSDTLNVEEDTKVEVKEKVETKVTGSKLSAFLNQSDHGSITDRGASFDMEEQMSKPKAPKRALPSKLRKKQDDTATVENAKKAAIVVEKENTVVVAKAEEDAPVLETVASPRTPALPPQRKLPTNKLKQFISTVSSEESPTNVVQTPAMEDMPATPVGAYPGSPPESPKSAEVKPVVAKPATVASRFQGLFNTSNEGTKEPAKPMGSKLLNFVGSVGNSANRTQAMNQTTEKSKLAAFMTNTTNATATLKIQEVEPLPQHPVSSVSKKQIKRSVGEAYKLIAQRGTYKSNIVARFSLEDKRRDFIKTQKAMRPESKGGKVDNAASNVLVPGIQCYVPDELETWALAEVEEYNSRTKVVQVVITNKDGSEDAVDINLKDPAVIQAIAGPNAKSIDTLPLAIRNEAATGIHDMRYLQYLNEPAILYNLQLRFSSEHPYTYSNDIVIAVNPYQWMDHLYGEKLQHSYYTTPREELEPHVYTTSTMAYKSMKQDGKNQSILVSGESGAGKTETTKIIMNHLATIAGGKNHSAISKVIEVNPLLESFGNATTIRNDNSSRFGKFTQMQFDAQGILIGATCETYLLEKSRVVAIEQDERNYHIFYQMLAGLSDAELTDYYLQPETMYEYAGLLEEMHINGIDDARLFQSTKSALTLIGLSDDEQSILFQLLAGILHLGQLEFEDELEEEKSAQALNPDDTDIVGEMLGLPGEAIEVAICNRTIAAHGDSCKVPLSSFEAEQNRDALAKSLYSKIFNWICSHINQAISADPEHVAGTIGVLDIFGFEHFEHNSFEQFCINYANEKLQQQFTMDVFKTVLSEYSNEGLALDHVSYSDNDSILQMIEGRMGIISMMNDHIHQPAGTEEALVNKLEREFKKKGSEVDAISFPRTQRTQFTIQHYAGAVNYEVVGFMEKHKDTLLPDLMTLMQDSTIELIQDMYKVVAEPPPTFGNRRRSKASALAQDTLGTQFKNSLKSLMVNIQTTNVHYVRCIKPNKEKSSTIFDKRMVVDQLRSAGVIDAIRISRSVYPNRSTPSEIVDRYGMMLCPSMRAGNSRNTSVAFLKELGWRSPIDYQMGKTMIYFKSGVFEELEAMKSDFFYEEATTIQKLVLGFLARCRFTKLLRSTILVQSIARMWIDRNFYHMIRPAKPVHATSDTPKSSSVTSQGVQHAAGNAIASGARSVSHFSTAATSAFASKKSSFSNFAKKFRPGMHQTPTSSNAVVSEQPPTPGSLHDSIAETLSNHESQLERLTEIKVEKQQVAKDTENIMQRVFEMEARAQRQLDSAQSAMELVPILQTENSDLKRQINDLQFQVTQLQEEHSELKEALHRVQPPGALLNSMTGTESSFQTEDSRSSSHYSDDNSDRSSRTFSSSYSGSDTDRSSFI